MDKLKNRNNKQLKGKIKQNKILFFILLFSVALLFTQVKVNNLILHKEINKIIFESYSSNYSFIRSNLTSINNIFIYNPYFINDEEKKLKGFLFDFKIKIESNYIKGFLTFDEKGKFKGYKVYYSQRNQYLIKAISHSLVKEYLIKEIENSNEAEFNVFYIRQELINKGFIINNDEKTFILENFIHYIKDLTYVYKSQVYLFTKKNENLL